MNSRDRARIRQIHCSKCEACDFRWAEEAADAEEVADAAVDVEGAVGLERGQGGRGRKRVRGVPQGRMRGP